jgi:hypothetical protein
VLGPLEVAEVVPVDEHRPDPTDAKRPGRTAPAGRLACKPAAKPVRPGE